jgi:hypothetical protein
MPPSRYAGSVSRSGSHGNGLHLARGPTSCDLFCSAGGRFWPTADQRVRRGMSAAGGRRHPSRRRAAPRRRRPMKAVSAFTPSAGGRLLQTHGRAPPAADGGVMRRWKQRLADARLLNHLIGGRPATTAFLDYCNNMFGVAAYHLPRSPPCCPYGVVRRAASLSPK